MSRISLNRRRIAVQVKNTADTWSNCQDDIRNSFQLFEGRYSKSRPITSLQRSIWNYACSPAQIIRIERMRSAASSTNPKSDYGPQYITDCNSSSPACLPYFTCRGVDGLRLGQERNFLRAILLQRISRRPLDERTSRLDAILHWKQDQEEISSRQTPRLHSLCRNCQFIPLSYYACVCLDSGDRYRYARRIRSLYLTLLTSTPAKARQCAQRSAASRFWLLLPLQFKMPWLWWAVRLLWMPKVPGAQDCHGHGRVAQRRTRRERLLWTTADGATGRKYEVGIQAHSSGLLIYG